MTIEEFSSLEKLNAAFYECAKVSAWKDSTISYKVNLLKNNVKLRNDLRNGTYKISPTVNFILNERGKIRYIESPVMRDRIVQKILCKDILVPKLTKYLIYDNYASLKNRGTTFARKRLDIALRNFIKKFGDGYILKIDIKKYFDNIDHEILKNMIQKNIHEPKEILNLIYYIIDNSSKSNKGLNLGSEVPQILAVYYLNPLDTYIKTVKGIKYYGRYMDDIYIFSNNKDELKELLIKIKEILVKLKLEINDKKTTITKISHGFTFMQIKYSIDNGKVIKRPTHSKIVRERRRLRMYKKLYDVGKISEKYVHNCYKTWRNSLIKDCNASKTSIKAMDQLYTSLFPLHEDVKKSSRKEVITNFLDEYKNRKE